MYIYQNGKLYIEKNGKLVGVEIYPDKTVIVAGTETSRAKKFQIYTRPEVVAKYHITPTNPYIFEVPKLEEKVIEKVVEDGTVGHVKSPTRGRPRKR